MERDYESARQEIARLTDPDPDGKGRRLAIQHVRTEFEEPIIIDGKYRVSVHRRGRKIEWTVETIEWIDGQPVYTRSKDSLEILLDGKARTRLT